MITALALPTPVVLVAGTALVFGCALAVAALLLGVDVPRVRLHMPATLERERDLAAGLGVPWRTWTLLRLTTLAAALAVGVLSGAWLVALLLAVGVFFALQFAVAGRSAKRKLRMERAFLAQLQVLRERMALAHQSLDTALMEIAASPGPELTYVLAPLLTGGSTADNIAETGIRSRSALIEGCCAVLIWARTRSLDALIDAIDDVLLPVGRAQLAVEEESLVTLTQQRAVIIAMGTLLAVMLASLLRVASFRSYYQSPQGFVVLIVAIALFCGLTYAVGRIVRVTRWSRWELRAILREESGRHA